MYSQRELIRLAALRPPCAAISLYAASVVLRRHRVWPNGRLAGSNGGDRAPALAGGVVWCRALGRFRSTHGLPAHEDFGLAAAVGALGGQRRTRLWLDLAPLRFTFEMVITQSPNPAVSVGHAGSARSGERGNCRACVGFAERRPPCLRDRLNFPPTGPAGSQKSGQQKAPAF
jgi:hypothetical protein